MTSKAEQDADLQPGPFVSYAREDQPFVRKLHEALQRRRRDTWVDWEGIVFTEEWMEKIRSAASLRQDGPASATPQSAMLSLSSTSFNAPRSNCRP